VPSKKRRKPFDGTGKCPICSQSFDDCRHSLTEAEERVREDRIWELVAEACSGLQSRVEALEGQVRTLESRPSCSCNQHSYGRNP
jgi:hypothetical protein